MRPSPAPRGSWSSGRLSAAAQQAVDRSEALFEQQKHFIGNASHELQTPLAVLGNRIEWLLDNTEPTEKQMEELLKMQRTLRQIVRLNKTLLLLTKIDNGQFPESSEVDLAAVVGEQVALYDEIYAGRGIACTVSAPEAFVVRMNESLASTLVTNLLKNAYLHTAEGGAGRGRTARPHADGDQRRYGARSMPNISSNASIRAPARRVPPVSDSRWSVPSGGITDCGSTIVSKGGATAFRFVGHDFFEKTGKISLRRGIFKFVSKSRMNFASSNKDNVQFI